MISAIPHILSKSATLDCPARNLARPEKCQPSCMVQFPRVQPATEFISAMAPTRAACFRSSIARSATFGYPEIDAGVIPAIHFTHLPRIVGRHRAFELLFSGRSFGAKEAY